MSHLIAPLESLFQGEEGTPRLKSIGIGDVPAAPPPIHHHLFLFAPGDGGNEVGMGKVYDRILASSISFARSIACRVAADHLVIA